MLSAGRIRSKLTDRSERLPVLADYSSPETNSVGAMRLLLALAVVVSHSFYLASGVPLVSEPLHAISGYTLGQHAVQLFFVLSGVLVTQSLCRADLISFALARALRIFPALVVCVLYVALLVGPLVSSLSPQSYFGSPELFGYVRDTLLLKTGMAPLPGVFDGNPAAAIVNSSVWTLKYEVVCYVLLGALGSAALRFGAARSAGLVALVAFMAWAAFDRPALAEGNSALDQVQYFALFFGTGVLAFALSAHLPIHWTGVVLAGLLLAFTNGTHWTEVGQAIGLGYVALWLTTFRFGPLRSFANRNDYSYGVYLFGVPVGQTLLHMTPQLSVAGLIAGTVVISLLFAFVSWGLIERPALALRHRLRERTPRSALPAYTDAGSQREQRAPSEMRPRPLPGAIA